MNRRYTIPVFTTLILTAPLYTIQAAPANWANNVIELRSDDIGVDQYVEVRLGRAPYKEVYPYYLESAGPDVWSGTQGDLLGKSLPLEPFWVIEAEQFYADDYTVYGNFAGDSLPLYVDRHVPTVSLNPALLGSGYGPNTQNASLSLTYEDQQDDWEYLVAKKDEILAQAGLTNSSRDFDKAQAAAAYIVQHVQGSNSTDSKKNAHSVDAFVNGSNCIGRAHAMVAMATVMGLPARKVNWYNHSTAEVLIDGEWRYVENHKPWINAIPEDLEQGPLFTFSFQELILDPPFYGFNTKTHKNMGNYNVHDKNGIIRGQPIYHVGMYATGVYSGIKRSMRQEGSGWYASSMLGLTALYSGESSHVYKGWTENSIIQLTPWRGIKYATGVDTHRVYAGHGIRKPFYLSELGDVWSVRAHLLFTPNNQHNIPEDGGNWYYQVNGNRFYLSDNGGWQERSYFAPDVTKKHYWNYVTFDIPLDVLRDTPCTNTDDCFLRDSGG